jgi:RimJ/RimL family protein N-acetyltransferase
VAVGQLAPLDLLLRVTTEDDAQLIARWGYPALADTSRLLDRDRAYYSVTNPAGEVVGCCCFGPEARHPDGDYSAPGLDLAAWLRPDLTGYGRGARFVATMLTFARGLFGQLAFRATVAAANKPALTACRRAGFRTVGRFRAEDGAEYLHLLFSPSAP